MGWMVEVVIALVLVVLTVWLTVYLLGGSNRRTREVRAQLEALTGTTITVVIGTVDDQEVQSICRVCGVVEGVRDDKLILSPSEGVSPTAWVWPVRDGTVRIRLERILGIERADGEIVFT